MNAAVVHSFDQPPLYGPHADPVAQDGEVLVTVRAAALSQLTRAIAAGKHYSGGGTLPMVPGVDGVGTLSDGRRVYFAFPTTGAMAERAAVPAELTVPVPDGIADGAAAAIANPGMSSWAALVERAQFKAGERVLVNGATGTSGRLAVQVARHLGAAHVIATGRNRAALDRLGADETVELEQSPEGLSAAFGRVAPRVDVVLDYLWGPPAERLIGAFAGHGGASAEHRVRYVQIGSMAGQSINLPGAALRSSGLELLGSGLGSVSRPALLRSIAGVLAAVAAGAVSVEYDAVPLSDVAPAWSAKGADRVVFTP